MCNAQMAQLKSVEFDFYFLVQSRFERTIENGHVQMYLAKVVQIN